MSNDLTICCAVCGVRDSLQRCSRCHLKYYCSREHQRHDWKKHKSECFKPVLLPCEGSSENEILNARTETLSPSNLQDLDFREREQSPTEKALKNINSTTPITGENIVHPRRASVKDFPEISLQAGGDTPRMGPLTEHLVLEEVCRNVIRDMDAYGVCVVDSFLGRERGLAVLEEVRGMYSKGVFKDGQLVSSKGRSDLKTIRGDQITWRDGREPDCYHIGQLISQVDAVIMRANKMVDNGKMGQYTINGRTKAMVACYPGSGSHYVKHVDNPNRDGRCITAIYYLNLGWNVQKSGGLLRIFPEGWRDRVADIPPLFDRILFFWSDRRNPHEVQPAHHTRYAITLWYFDAGEREQACKRYQKELDHGRTLLTT